MKTGVIQKLIIILLLSVLVLSSVSPAYDIDEGNDEHTNYSQDIPTSESTSEQTNSNAVVENEKSEIKNNNHDNNGLKLYLNWKTFDPLLEKPSIPFSYKISEQESEYFIIQMDDNRVYEWEKKVLDLSGAKLFDYIPDGAFIAKIEHQNLPQIKGLKFVRWIGPYQPVFKIHKDLFDIFREVNINLQIFEEDGNLEKVVEQIRELGGSINDIRNAVNSIEITISSDCIRTIAFISQVKWIGKIEGELVPCMNIVRRSSYTGAESLHTLGYNGSGIVGEVKEWGFDFDHYEYNDRILAVEGLPYDDDAHGTSTFGEIFAKGVNPNARGMLPEAKGVFCDIESYERWASIHNLWNNYKPPGVFQSNSWGWSGGMYGEYTDYSQENDQAVYDHDHVTVCYAAGNYNDFVMTDAAAKNVIGVGGVETDNDNNPSNDWHSSAHFGPTQDGRIKPDLVGHYRYVFTTDVLGDNWPDDYSSGNYTEGDFFKGTSAATPIVAGCVGIVYQMYKNNHFGNNPNGNWPHTSTVKALLINHAYQYPFSAIKDINRYTQGWGYPDVEAIYNDPHCLIIDEKNTLTTGQLNRWNVSHNTGSLKATLVWTDYPGSTMSSKALVNDLTLRVLDPHGKEYWGNNGLEYSHWSTPGGFEDHTNNVENVFIQFPENGNYTIEVIASNVPYPQDYALVVSGGNLVGDPDDPDDPDGLGNRPPHTPNSPTPPNGAQNVKPGIALQWKGGDPEMHYVYYHIYFDTAYPPMKLESTQDFTYYIPILWADTDYYWQIVAEDELGAKSYGPIWYFKTSAYEDFSNTQPYYPRDPVPADGATQVPLDQWLSWTGGDPDGDYLIYEVYLDDDPTPTFIASTDQQTLNPNLHEQLIKPDKHYYWRITAKEPFGCFWTNGPTWDFYTIQSPIKPCNPSPSIGEEVLPEGTILTWDSGSPDPGVSVTFDIYFGTTYNLDEDDLAEEGYKTPRYNPGTLNWETTYYWRIVAKDHRGLSTEGPLWYFKIGEDHSPYKPSDPDPPDGATDVYIYLESLSWDGGDPDNGDQVWYDIYFDTKSDPEYNDTIGPYPAEQARITYYDLDLPLEIGTVYYWKIIARDDDPESSNKEGPVWEFTTDPNHYPDYPSDPFPPDGATGLRLDPTLKVKVSDPDGDAMNVMFIGWHKDDPMNQSLIGWDYNVPNGSYASVEWSVGLDHSTTYVWHVVADDQRDKAAGSQEWTFTTARDIPSRIYSDPELDGGLWKEWGDFTQWNGIYMQDCNAPVNSLYFNYYKDYTDEEDNKMGRAYLSFDTSHIGNLTGKEVKLWIKMRAVEYWPDGEITEGSLFQIYEGHDRIGSSLGPEDWDSCQDYTGIEVDVNEEFPENWTWFWKRWVIPNEYINTEGYTDFELKPTDDQYWTDYWFDPWGWIEMSMPENHYMVDWPYLEVTSTSPTIFLDGSCFYDTEKDNKVSDLTVEIRNLNKPTKRWIASTTGSYYTLGLEKGEDIQAGDTLRYIAKDDTQWINTTYQTFNQNDILVGDLAIDLILKDCYKIYSNAPSDGYIFMEWECVNNYSSVYPSGEEGFVYWDYIESDWYGYSQERSYLSFNSSLIGNLSGKDVTLCIPMYCDDYGDLDEDKFGIYYGHDVIGPELDMDDWGCCGNETGHEVDVYYDLDWNWQWKKWKILNEYMNLDGFTDFELKPIGDPWTSASNSRVVIGMTENYDTTRRPYIEISHHHLVLEGYCFYDDEKANSVNNLNVNIVNTNTDQEWSAEITDNYYRLDLEIGIDVNVGDTLQYIAKDDIQWVNITDYTVCSGDIETEMLTFDFILKDYYKIFSIADADGGILKEWGDNWWNYWNYSGNSSSWDDIYWYYLNNSDHVYSQKRSYLSFDTGNIGDLKDRQVSLCLWMMRDYDSHLEGDKFDIYYGHDEIGNELDINDWDCCDNDFECEVDVYRDLDWEFYRWIKEIVPNECINVGGCTDFELKPIGDPWTEGWPSSTLMAMTEYDDISYRPYLEVIPIPTVVLKGHCFFDAPKNHPVDTLMVDIINLNTGQEWRADTIDNFYRLKLKLGVDVNISDTLRFIAKDGENWIEIKDRPMTPMDVDAGFLVRDFILDEYYLDLTDFPMYLAGEHQPGDYNENQLTGAAAAQMNLNYMWWDSSTDEPPLHYDDQSWLFEYAHANNSNTSLPFIDAEGMLTTIRLSCPEPYEEYGYHFNIAHDVDPDVVLYEICRWIDYDAGKKPGHPLHVPGAVPIFSDYSRWMSVRGIHANTDPSTEPESLNVYGLWVNDPYPQGIGENTYKTAEEWKNTYFHPLTVPDDPYKSEYVSIIEPPLDYSMSTEKKVQIIPSPPMWSQNPGLQSTSGSYLKEKNPENSKIVNTAQQAINSQLLPYSDEAKTVFKQSYPGWPLYIHNLIDDKHDYYIIPFRNQPELYQFSSLWEKSDQASTLAVVLIEACDGHFREASWVQNPVQYLPLDQQDALHLVYQELKNLGYNPEELNSRTMNIDLVYRQLSPYYPEWRINIPSLHLTFYVSQKGEILTI